MGYPGVTFRVLLELFLAIVTTEIIFLVLVFTCILSIVFINDGQADRIGCHFKFSVYTMHLFLLKACRACRVPTLFFGPSTWNHDINNGYIGSVEILFRKFEAPLAPSLSPLGTGPYDSSVLPRNPDLGNAALS